MNLTTLAAMSMLLPSASFVLYARTPPAFAGVLAVVGGPAAAPKSVAGQDMQVYAREQVKSTTGQDIERQPPQHSIA